VSEAIHQAAAGLEWIAASLVQHMMTTAYGGATFSLLMSKSLMSKSRVNARRRSRGGKRPRLAAVSPS
jgi:hypothetical protein